MSRWMRRLGNGLRYTGALVFAGVADHRRLRALADALRAAAEAYRRGGLPAWAEQLEDSSRTLPAPRSLERMLGLADALAAAGRRQPFRYCLRRSSLRYVVLKSAGRSPRLRIGVERVSAPAPGLDGHAWVEVDGQPFCEEDDRSRRLTVVFETPPRGPAQAP